MIRIWPVYSKWFRNFIRKRFRPMSIDEAEQKREFFAKLYCLTAALLFGVTVRSFFKSDEYNGQLDESLPKHEALAKYYGLKGTARVINFEGFKKVEDITFEVPDSTTEEVNK